MYAYVFYIKAEVRAQQGPRETGESEKTDSLRIITDKNTHTLTHTLRLTQGQLRRWGAAICV